MVEPNPFPYEASVLFIKKKGNTLRTSVGYRKVSESAVQNVSPLPVMNDLLNQLLVAEMFSSTDFSQETTGPKLKRG